MTPPTPDSPQESTRVLIKDKAHPWYGHSGVVSQKMLSDMPGMVVVELDNGLSSGCYTYQLEEL